MMKKLKDKKGFTLAELLIVIAIIAVLVGIMVPVFGNQLGKAKQAADLANVRATYVEAVSTAMLNGDYDKDTNKIKVPHATLEAAAKNNSAITYKTNTSNEVTGIVVGTSTEVIPVDTDVEITGRP